MRIAQVAPLHESVPPKLYGGTERVVSFLTEQLVALGHRVTLFASGDSVTRAHLVAGCRQSLRLAADCDDVVAPHILQMEQVAAMADEFDVIHFHVDPFHYSLARRVGTPCLTTLHGRLDVPGSQPLFREFTDLAMVSISDDQRRPVPDLNWVATVHHGLPADLLRPGDGGGGYLAFLGRISPEKGPDAAIEIATRAGLPLKIAAKIATTDRPYFERAVAPLLDRPGIEFIGEIDERRKQDFLGGAIALLAPIDWPEPFGLVSIEAMACGTPVVTRPRGSMPEIIEPGVTGFLAEGIDDAAAAVTRAAELDRAAIRRAFEGRFTADRMARDYAGLYERAIRQVGGASRRAAG